MIGKYWLICQTQSMFPSPQIFATLERPDIVIQSGKLRKVLLIELICSSKENIKVAQLRKQTRYLQLMDQITSNTNWSPSLYTIEVGARGFIAHSLEQTFLRLVISRRILSKVCKCVSIIAARCSFAIYLSANSIIWDKNRSLIVLDAYFFFVCVSLCVYHFCFVRMHFFQIIQVYAFLGWFGQGWLEEWLFT